MSGRKLSWLPAGAGLAGLGLALGFAAVAAQGGGTASPDLVAPDAEAPFANRPPLVGVRGGTVRAGENLVLAAYASDMESEAVHLEVSLDLQPGQPAPSWLGQSVWTADLAAQPILRIPLSPPADAEPGTYSLLVGATDSGGLTSWRRMTLEILPPAEPEPSAGASPDSSGGITVAGASNGAVPKGVFSKASPAASSTTDSPSLNLSVSPASMAEGASGDIVVSATLMGVSMVPGMDVVGALQVSGTATAGTDYTLTGTKSVTIPAGSATLTGTRTLKLSALADELRREDDETVKFKVTQVTRGTEVLPLSSAAKTSVTITNVYAKPPKVTGVSAEAARCGSRNCPLKVSWDAPAASPPLTAQFVQHRRADKPDGDWTRMDVSASATEAVVTGLQPGRRYHVRVRARNKVGKSGWSDAVAANTAPLVTVSADDGGVGSINEGNAKARIRLTGSAKAKGGGTLTGRWFRIYPSPNHQQSEIKLPAGSSFAMVSKQDYSKSPSSDTPEERTYRLEVTHELSGDTTVGSADVALRWLPKVVLGASPSSVPEDGGARTVTVEAKLTGKSVGSEAKSVSVKVKGGTATEGTDFAAVSGFTISIPGGTRNATGTFTLTPTADTAAEGGETVKVKGTATEGTDGPELKVKAAEVSIEDERVALTVSPAPTKGKVTGTGIDCGAGTSGDCSETVTKSAEVSLTASPATGYVFNGWTGACSSEKSASCAVVVSGATTVGASFRRPKVTVEVSPTAGGSVTGSGIDCGAGTTDDCKERVSGGSIALTASPASGYAVSSWSGGGCSGTGTTCTAAVTADTKVTVTFAERPALAAPSGLSASPSDGQVTLSWTDPSDATITGYELRYKAGSGAYGSWADISGSGAATTSHTVTGLTNGTAHTFQLRAENSTGAGSSATVSATPDAVPGLVSSVTAAATGAAAASVTWTAPTTGGTVASYEVSGSGTIAVSGTSATVTGLSQATDYKWTVQAVNASGSSAAAESNTIQIPHLPGLVTNLSAAAASGSSATLTWTAPAATAAEGAASSYAVSGDGTIVVSGTTATITGLSKNTDYSWTVAAENVSGTGSAVTSNSIRIPNAPGSVTGLSAVAASGSSATLAWTAPAVTATEGMAASYAVSGDGTIVVSGTTATITGLSKNTDYSWTVAAENVSGTGSAVTSNSVRIPHAPGSVTGLSAAAASGSSATLTWTAPAATATTGAAASYAVSGDGTIAVSGTTATITGLSKNTDYSWTVAAVNVSGTGSAVTSNSVRIPHAPGSVTGLSAASASGSSATLTWTAPAATATAGAAASYAVSGDGTIAVSGTTATITGLSKNTDYSWTVAAVNVSGTGSAVTSNSVRIPHAPGPVTGLSAAASGSSATLTWTAPAVTATAGAASSYAVSGGGTIVVSGTSAAVTGLIAGSAYTWTVAAVNVSGTSSTASVSLTMPTTVTLRVARSPGVGGTVTGSKSGSTVRIIDCGADCAKTVNSGTVVNLTATAADGYRFKNWTGCDSASGSVCAQTLGADESVTANFERVWTLTAAASPDSGGKVEGGGINCGEGVSGTEVCSKVLAEGDVVLTAAAADGYRFKNWTGCDSANGNVCTQRVNGNESVTANFQKVWRLTVDVDPDSGGKVTGGGINCGHGVPEREEVCEKVFDEGFAVNLTAAAADGYRFKNWTGCGSANGNVCTQRVNGNESVTANFQRVWILTVDVDPDSGGKVTGGGINCGHGVPEGEEVCEKVFDEGFAVNLTAAAADGYRFKNWTGCGSANGNVCTQRVNGNETVTANFQKVWTLTVDVDPAAGGKVTGGGINCGHGVPEGEEVCEKVFDEGFAVNLTAAAAAADGYRFKNWTGCGSPNGSSCTQTINGDERVTANFEEIVLTVSIEPTGGGTVTGVKVGSTTKIINCGSDCSEAVSSGTDVTLTAAANAGYRFKSWTGCDSASGSTCTQDVTGKETVDATFEYTLSVDPGGRTGSDGKKGHYIAIYSPASANFGVIAYSYVTVTATASGGVRLSQSPWYTYQWEAGISSDTVTTGRRAYYIFLTFGTHEKTVTVTDANNKTATATAKIQANDPGGAGGQSAEPIAIPLGGTVTFILNGQESVTASSSDAGVAGISVNGGTITVSGVSAGAAEVVAQVSAGEFRIPVQVGG